MRNNLDARKICIILISEKEYKYHVEVMKYWKYFNITIF